MAANRNSKGSRLFIIAFVIFLSVIVMIVMDMAGRTTAPWNKPAAPEAVPDSVGADSLFGTDSL